MAACNSVECHLKLAGHMHNDSDMETNLKPFKLPGCKVFSCASLQGGNDIMNTNEHSSFFKVCKIITERKIWYISCLKYMGL